MTLETKLFIIALVFVSPVIYFVAAFLLLSRLRKDVSHDCFFSAAKPYIFKKMAREKFIFGNFGMAATHKA